MIHGNATCFNQRRGGFNLVTEALQAFQREILLVMLIISPGDIIVLQSRQRVLIKEVL